MTAEENANEDDARLNLPPEVVGDFYTSLADELAFELSSPQAYVLALARAQLAADMVTVGELFTLIDRAELWQAVTVVALAEFTQELAEHRGEKAEAWLKARLEHGLDP